MATGFSTQSELWPSACMVDEPSKPHSGSCSSVGNEANSLICVLPRRFGVGVYPSSQIYSSLYLVIEPLLSLMLWNAETEAFGGLKPPGPAHVYPAHVRPPLTKQLKCQSLPYGAGRSRGCPAGGLHFLMRHRSAAAPRAGRPKGAFSPAGTPDSPAVLPHCPGPI